MPNNYSQFRALVALTRASFKAMLRSPSAVAFTIGFPLIFILAFGFMNNGGTTLKIGFTSGSDTTNIFYQTLRNVKSVQITPFESEEEMKEQLEKGQIIAVLDLSKGEEDGKIESPSYNVNLSISHPDNNELELLEAVLKSVETKIDLDGSPDHERMKITETRVPGKIYRSIDFVLPGMLGFSLLSTGVFGTAFLFFGLRQTLVLKRFFATPVKKFYILLGEALARLIFQLLGAIFLIVVGYYLFQFTLVNGLLSVLEILLLSAIGLIVFMGFGFIISSVARSSNTIPPLANVVVIPQFILTGTFFPISAFPTWMQPFCKILPLTPVNDALREISFEGAHLWQLPKELLLIVGWGIAIYIVAIKVFKWE